MERAARKTYLDGIRIIACLCVIYNHVMGPGVIGDTAARFGALLSYFPCKMAVPLFFMITGALLLPKVDTYRKTLWRCLRIALVLALFFTLNYAAYCVKNGEAFDVSTLVMNVYRDRLGVTYSYWYLYRYLSVLIMLPVFQRMMPRMERRDIRYFLLLSVGICGLLPACVVLARWLLPNERLAIPLFSIYIGMLLMGYAIDRYLARKRSYMILAGAGLVVCNLIAAYLYFRAQAINPANAAYLDRCERTSIVLGAGCAFYLLKCLDGALPLSSRARERISGVGRLMFCVYLVSELLIDNLTFIRTWLAARLPIYGAEWLYVLIVFAAGMGVAAVLTRVPLLKKLL